MSILTLPRIAAAILGDRPWYAAHPITLGHPDENNVMWLREPVLGKGLRWATEADRYMADYTILDTVAVAELLFCSGLSPATDADDAQVLAAIDTQLAACDCNLLTCAARVGQEAGDHPAAYCDRMAWCLLIAARATGGAG